MNTINKMDQIGIWAKQSVAKAVKTGIVSGYGDGSFRPNAQITRAEMAVMIARALKLPLKTKMKTGFTDDEAIPEWAKGAVETIRELGIASGREGNKFVPKDMATRAEAATILLRMLDIQQINMEKREVSWKGVFAFSSLENLYIVCSRSLSEISFITMYGVHDHYI